MNERIKLLWEQAAKTTQGDSWEEQTKFMERYTELIVRECISCVGSQGDKVYLKKHFGLPVESDIVYPATDESWSVKSQYNREYNFPK
jgi:hypothetical protein